MAEIAAILVAAGLFIAGFVAWYTMWHRRMAAAFERVRSARTVRLWWCAAGRICPATGAERPVTAPHGDRRRLLADTISGLSVRHSVILMARLFGTRNLRAMSIRWRIGLAALIAAAIVGGFVPHGVLSVADASATQVARAVEAPLSGSVNCADATCGKGNTAPAAPSPGIALVAVVAGVLGAGGSCRLRPPPAWTAFALPAGARDPLFHPPQFS